MNDRCEWCADPAATCLHELSAELRDDPEKFWRDERSELMGIIDALRVEIARRAVEVSS